MSRQRPPDDRIGEPLRRVCRRYDANSGSARPIIMKCYSIMERIRGGRRSAIVLTLAAVACLGCSAPKPPADRVVAVGPGDSLARLIRAWLGSKTPDEARERARVFGCEQSRLLVVYSFDSANVIMTSRGHDLLDPRLAGASASRRVDGRRGSTRSVPKSIACATACAKRERPRRTTVRVPGQRLPRPGRDASPAGLMPRRPRQNVASCSRLSFHLTDLRSDAQETTHGCSPPRSGAAFCEARAAQACSRSR